MVFYLRLSYVAQTLRSVRGFRAAHQLHDSATMDIDGTVKGVTVYLDCDPDQLIGTVETRR
jgi:hypothetical protein